MDYSQWEYREDLYKKTVEKYGMEHQIMKAVEEMAELIKALCDIRQGRCDVWDVAEEMADVHIMLEQLMLEQLMLIFDCGDQIDRKMMEHLSRLHYRVQQEDL